MNDEFLCQVIFDLFATLSETYRFLEILHPPESLEKLYNARIVRCETGHCGDHILEESMNCVTECVSKRCHHEASFDVNPLEDGEIDEGRAIMFAQCVKHEILREKYNARAALKK